MFWSGLSYKLSTLGVGEQAPNGCISIITIQCDWFRSLKRLLFPSGKLLLFCLSMCSPENTGSTTRFMLTAMWPLNGVETEATGDGAWMCSPRGKNHSWEFQKQRHGSEEVRGKSDPGDKNIQHCHLIEKEPESQTHSERNTLPWKLPGLSLFGNGQRRNFSPSFYVLSRNFSRCF